MAEAAHDRDAANVAVIHATDRGDEFDLIILSIGNSEVQALLEQLHDVPDVHVAFEPRGVIALQPPASKAPQQVVDVQPVSALEVYLSGLQSVGSWSAFLGYAAAAGFVVWIGLFTETAYLLVAAMLIAPYAGPAMNSALATARGDRRLFGRSLLRYVAALAVTIVTCFLLSMAFRQKIASGLMVEQSMISAVAILLPVTAGAAGALNLCQSERNSLVTGAATGMLIAASLAPPAGIFGMAMAIGKWSMVEAASFLLLLQIAAINISGAIVFRIYGVSPQGGRYERGQKRWPAALGLGSLVALAGLLWWQFSNPPNLQRSSTSQRAAEDAREAIEATGVAKVVQLDAQFTRADIQGQNTLLVTGYVQSGRPNPEQVKQRVEERVRERLSGRYNVTPVVSLTVVAQ